MDDITRKLIRDAVLADTLILAADFLDKPYLTEYLLVPHDGPYLPVEVVVYKPEFVVPRRIRWYAPDLYLWHKDNHLVGFPTHESALLTYDEARKVEGFTGTSGTPGLFPVTLHEVWKNHGADGHTQYRLVGYRFTWQKAPAQWKYDHTYFDGRPKGEGR